MRARSSRLLAARAPGRGSGRRRSPSGPAPRADGCSRAVPPTRSTTARLKPGPIFSPARRAKFGAAPGQIGVGRVVGDGLAGGDRHVLVDRQADPHVVHRHARRLLPPPRVVPGAVGLHVGQVRLDVDLAIGAAVAAQDDVAGMQQLALLRVRAGACGGARGDVAEQALCHGRRGRASPGAQPWLRTGVIRRRPGVHPLPAAPASARAPSSRSRRSTVSAGTSPAVKASPGPRSSTKRIAPSRTFLSLRIRPISPPRRSRAAGRRCAPACRTACRCAITRPGSSWLQWPSRADSAAASPRPTATASPCSSVPSIAALGLQRMAEGVAEVEQRAAALGALLALVAGDDGGLQPAALQHGMRQRRGIAARTARGAVRLAPVPQRLAGEQPVLGHLGLAGAQFARRQGGQRRRYRPARCAAGGRRRPGSCRRTG